MTEITEEQGTAAQLADEKKAAADTMLWAEAEIAHRNKQIAHLWHHRKPFWERVSEALDEQLGTVTKKCLITLGPLEYVEYIHTKFGKLRPDCCTVCQIDQYGRFLDHGRIICAGPEPGIHARLLTEEEKAAV